MSRAPVPVVADPGPMPRWAQRYVLGTGLAALAGAGLHVAIAIGGPAWYAFFGAPQRIVELARDGAAYAPISCALIAGVLLVFAAYAFAAAGRWPRLPLLRPVLGLIAAVLVLRGLLFVPLILWRPDALARVCDCRRVDTFIVATSLLCLAMGIGYAIGAWHARRPDRDGNPMLRPGPVRGGG